MSEKSSIGEMVLNAINMTNQLFEESGSTSRLKEDLSGGEADYDVYAASKKGAPKDDYPSKRDILPNCKRLCNDCDCQERQREEQLFLCDLRRCHDREARRTEERSPS